MEISGLYFLNMKTHGSKYKILESVKYNAASGAVVGKLKFLQTECICLPVNVPCQQSMPPLF